MTDILSFLNGGAVSIFGSVLSVSFCNVWDKQRNRRIFFAGMIFILLFQGAVYYCVGDLLIRKIYPVTMHLPLLFVLYIMSRKFVWPLICILASYLCCQLRRWLALFVVAIANNMISQDLVELIITIPLLAFLVRYISPVFKQISNYPCRAQIELGLVPLLYYLFDYATTVYTELLTTGHQVAVEFMPFICCTIYLVFIMYNSAEKQSYNRLLQAQNGLRIQLKQSVREINALRESQNLAKQYRHDLRHHLHYLSSCIENEQKENALQYISAICNKIDSRKVNQYCENEEANLILSAFVGRAEKEGIGMKINGFLPAFIVVSDVDLCVLLSNALENALNACMELTASGTSCMIEIEFFERDGKLFIQVANPCDEKKVRFIKGIPVSEKPGHGIGVQSICTIVEQYGGLISFSLDKGMFVLRVSL